MLYVPTHIVNHGTYWSAGELRKLNSLVVSGLDWDQIGHQLKREPSACKVQDAIIRKLTLFQSTDDTATMCSLRKSNNLARLELNILSDPEPRFKEVKGQSQVMIGANETWKRISG